MKVFADRLYLWIIHFMAFNEKINMAAFVAHHTVTFKLKGEHFHVLYCSEL